MIRKFRSRTGRAGAALLLAGLGACTTPGRVTEPLAIAGEEQALPWTRVMAQEHLARLEALDGAWSAALGAARAGGFARRIQNEGALLEPGAGRPWVSPSPGSYRCRRIRLGSPGRGGAMAVAGPFFCHMGDEGEQLSLTQQTGPERPGGYLWRDGDRRMVFIGALARGREGMPPAYGEDSARDVTGLFERIGAFRYRLVIPREAGMIEVLELVPALPPA